jgi:hypothetical protein
MARVADDRPKKLKKIAETLFADRKILLGNRRTF